MSAGSSESHSRSTSARARLSSVALSIKISVASITRSPYRLYHTGCPDSDTARGRLHFPPPRSGGGGPLELAKRASRGGGGAGLAASLSLQKALVARRSEHAKMS